MKPERKFMEQAIGLAEAAAGKGDYPIGSVVVMKRRVIGSGWDSLKSSRDPVMHAEIIAIREAVRNLGSPYLSGCILYSTMEPCPMCAAAAVWARMGGVVFGATLEDMKEHARKHASENYTFRTIGITCKEVLDKGEPRLPLKEGFMRKECARLFHLVK